MKIFRFHKSFNSVVIGLAKSGSFIPPEIAHTMTQNAIDYRCVNRHLIALCECSQLRDTGLIATNVSPLVVDLTRPLIESPADSHINALYHQTTPDGQVVYKDAQHQLQASDHQLRRDTFYLPFFQKIKAELDRLTKTSENATLLMVSCDSQLKNGTVSIAGDVSSYDFSSAIQAAKELDIEFEISPTEGPFADQRFESDSVTACSLKISPESLPEGDDWSEQEANRLREFLAKLVATFVPSDL